MTLSQRQLLDLLREKVNVGEIVPGYDYTIYSLRCSPRDIGEVVAELRANKNNIENEYNKTMRESYPGNIINLVLLDFVCIPLKHAVWIPTPFDILINVFGEAIKKVCLNMPEVRYPYWS